MNINADDIYQIIIKANDNVEKNNLNETIALKDMGLDSLDIYTVLIGIEEKYKIKIPDEDIDKLKCVKDMIAYIQENN